MVESGSVEVHVRVGADYSLKHPMLGASLPHVDSSLSNMDLSVHKPSTDWADASRQLNKNRISITIRLRKLQVPKQTGLILFSLFPPRVPAQFPNVLGADYFHRAARNENSLRGVKCLSGWIMRDQKEKLPKRFQRALLRDSQ